MISQHSVYGGLTSFSLDRSSPGSGFSGETMGVVLGNPELTLPDDADDLTYQFYWEAYFADQGMLIR